jgi:hypothetical protein
VNPALLAPAATVTDSGTTTAALLLFRLTASPPAPAGAVSSTVHASVPTPVIVPLLHGTALSVPGAAAAIAPVPLSGIAAVASLDELLTRLNAPAAAPGVIG